MSNFNIQTNGRIRLLIVLILPFITLISMAQTKYKTVNEAEGLQIGDIVENFSALDQHDEMFTLKEANLKTHSDESQRLPIPATFIIGQDGKIVWRHFDPDYKQRSSVLDIVRNIPKILSKIKDISHIEAKMNSQGFHNKMIL